MIREKSDPADCEDFGTMNTKNMAQHLKKEDNIKPRDTKVSQKCRENFF